VQTATLQTITSERKWIELDHSFDGAKIWLTYLPMNAEGEAGDPVKSEAVVLRGRRFVKNTDDESGNEKTAEVDPSIKERLTPIVKLVIQTIDPVRRPIKEETEFQVGQRLHLVFEYRGPPAIGKSIQWERLSDGHNWASVSMCDNYEIVRADRGSQLRAVLRITTPAVEPVEYVAGPVQIANNDPVMRRVAGTMQRSGKAIFDALLLTGQPVVIIIEGQPGKANMAIKQGASDTFKSPVRELAAEAVRECSVELKGRFGYRTELAIAHKKTTGGINFPPPDARDLFIQVLDAFKGDDGQQGTKRKSAAGQKKI
jgi:hypothetical protein